jgi:hypothetical protein
LSRPVAVVLVIGAGAVGFRCCLLLDRGLATELVRAQFQVVGDQVADLVAGAQGEGMDQPLDLGLVVGQGGDLVLQAAQGQTQVGDFLVGGDGEGRGTLEVVGDPGHGRGGVAPFQGGEQRFNSGRGTRGAEFVLLRGEAVPLVEQQEVADDLQAMAQLGLVDGRGALSVFGQEGVEGVEVVGGDAGLKVVVTGGDDGDALVVGLRRR